MLTFVATPWPTNYVAAHVGVYLRWACRCLWGSSLSVCIEGCRLDGGAALQLHWFPLCSAFLPCDPLLSLAHYRLDVCVFYFYFCIYPFRGWQWGSVSPSSLQYTHNIIKSCWGGEKGNRADVRACLAAPHLGRSGAVSRRAKPWSR